jgi:hypothetical protein
MIFNIELPFSLNKIGIRIRIRAYMYGSGSRRPMYGSGSIYSFSTDILYHFSSDWCFREKLLRKFDEISRKLWHLSYKFSFSRKVKKVFSSQPYRKLPVRGAVTRIEFAFVLLHKNECRYFSELSSFNPLYC